MRQHAPVTQQEFTLADGETLLATTDVQPLRTITFKARDLASGRHITNSLTKQSDEIGVMMRSLQQARLNLASLVAGIQGKASSVRALADTLHEDSVQLTDGSVSAAVTLFQSALVMQQVTGALQDNTEHATVVVREVGSCVQELTHNLDTMERLNKALEHMGHMHDKISNIVDLLDGVTFQTNLLALNAAVEVAKAGGHGKGFAVTAAELRQFSKKSAQWAEDIRGLIHQSPQQMNSCRQESTQNLGSLSRVGSAVCDLEHRLGQMESAQQAQAYVVEEICTAIAQLEQGVQGNKHMAEEVTRCSQQLKEQAGRLNEAASVFHLARQVRGVPHVSV